MNLLREAHLRGSLDFRQARPLDRRWWRGAGWILDGLEQQRIAEAWKLKFQLHLALLDYSLDSETFTLHWEQARLAQQHLRAGLLPWLEEETLSPTAAAGLTALWQNVWGNPDDPEVVRRIQETAAGLHGQNRAGKVKNG